MRYGWRVDPESTTRKSTSRASTKSAKQQEGNSLGNPRDSFEVDRKRFLLGGTLNLQP
jgi:hypothetical protein